MEDGIESYFFLYCRLGNDEMCGPSTSGLFMCAVCQVDLGASEGISVHASSIFSTSSNLGKVLSFALIVVIRKMPWRENDQVESKSLNTSNYFPRLTLNRF